MKRNSLIVQSLIMLPLLTAAPLLSMEYAEKETPYGKNNRKQKRYEKKINKKNNNTNQKQHITTEKEPVSPEVEKDPAVQVSHQKLMNELATSAIYQKQRTQNSSDSSSTHEYHPITTEPIDYAQLPLIQELIDELGGEPYIVPNSLIKSETEVMTLPLPLCMQKQTLETPSINQDLLQSVMLPTEEKPLSFFETLSYTFSTSHQILMQVINQLTTKTFDASDRRAINIFTQAVTTATNNGDVASLATIADLCHQNYPQTIRLFDDVVAQQASGFLNAHYMTELTRANEAMRSQRQEHLEEWTVETAACVKAMTDIITSYNEKTKNISNNYHGSIEKESARIKTLRTQVSTFGLLNKQVRENTDTLLTKNKLDLPTNQFAKTMQESEKKLNFLAKVASEMPQITVYKPKTHKCLELDNKK